MGKEPEDHLCSTQCQDDIISLKTWAFILMITLYFMNNNIVYTSFWAHIVDFWKMLNEAFIFFVTYEEMKRDLAGVLRKLSEFIERPQLTEDEMVKLVQHLSFDSMQKNDKTNSSGLWKNTSPLVKEEVHFQLVNMSNSNTNNNDKVLLTGAAKSRMVFPMKRYATKGKNIPLEKNWSETWCTMSEHFGTVADEFLHFDVRPDDVFVVTFMKCGTTWMQECAWLLMNNLDYEKSKETVVMLRSPFLDFHGGAPFVQNHVELCKKLSSPRLIKSHLPANLLPLQIWEKKQKIIYVARNAKDVIVSCYHFVKNLGMYTGDNIRDYAEDFMNNNVVYSSFWTHIVDFWKMRNEPFIFFVTYEEMKRDLAGVLRKLSDFLERPQLTEDEMVKLVQHLSFDSMKKNDKTNLTGLMRETMPTTKEEFQFMRRGIVGSFKDELTPDLQAKIDKWSAEFLSQHGLKESDIFGEL